MPAAGYTKYTEAEFRRLLKCKSKGRIILIGPYDGMRHTKFKCLKHAHEYSASAKGVLRKDYKSGNCKHCKHEIRLCPFIKKYLRHLKKLKGGRYELRGVYDGTYKSVRHYCHEHDLEFMATPYRMVNSGYVGCTKCKADKRKINSKNRVAGKNLVTYEQYATWLHFNLPNIRVSRTDYHRFHRKCRHKCLKHGVVWNAPPANFYRGAQRGCKQCWADEVMTLDNRYKFKDYQLGNRTVRVQGYEHLALDWLVDIKGINPQDIVVSTERAVPVILWDGEEKSHRHYPDIFIKSRSIIVEVKSPYTFGFFRQEQFERNKRKYWAARAQGWDYRFLVFDKRGTRYKLPHNWHELSWNEWLNKTTKWQHKIGRGNVTLRKVA